MRRLVSVVSYVLFALTVPALAQNAATSLRGTVSDATGAVLTSATVSITNNSVGTVSTTKSNKQGEYAFQQVTPGDYTITVKATGFAERTLTATLLVAQPATVDVKLGVTAESQTIDVTAATETINTTDATIGNAIDNQTIMELPSEARNPQTLLALQPGVLYIGGSDSTESRNGAVSGARADQTNITLDGVDNNDQIAPAAFTGVLRTTLDSTEEFRVTTSNANADTGRSSGGQVNLVTRSGTNQVHGALYDYNRTNLGQANEWFLKQSQLASGEPNIPGKLIYNVYGTRLGGPIKRDKIFLFGNYEGFRQDVGGSVVETVPLDSLKSGVLSYTSGGNNIVLSPAQVASMDPHCTANGTCPLGAGDDPASLAVFKLYPKANGLNTGDGLNSGSFTFSSPVLTIENVYITRADFNLSDKHRVYIRASMQNDSQGGLSQFPGQPNASKATDDSKGISGNYTWTISNSLVNNLRYGFVRQSFATTGIGNGNYSSFRGFSLPEATTRSSSTVVPMHNFIDDLTWTKGRHTLQFGGNYRRFDYQNNTDANSYNSAVTNSFWMVNSGFANKHGKLRPRGLLLPQS